MLNDSLDWDAIRKDYNEKGYTRVENILEADFAEKIVNSLVSDTDWELFYLSDDGSVSVSQQELQSYGQQQINDLNSKILSRAQHKFAYYYFRSALDETKNVALVQFYDYLRSEEFLGFTRYLTGESSIYTVNGQAACYRQSCFLKRHNDTTNSEYRVAAYVFGFTKEWREEWGRPVTYRRAERKDYRFIDSFF